MSTTTTPFKEAIAELRTAKSVCQWNIIRRKHKKYLTLSEMSRIDASGIITDTLGFDASYEDFWNRIESQMD